MTDRDHLEMAMAGWTLNKSYKHQPLIYLIILLPRSMIMSKWGRYAEQAQFFLSSEISPPVPTSDKLLIRPDMLTCRYFLHLGQILHRNHVARYSFFKTNRASYRLNSVGSPSGTPTVEELWEKVCTSECCGLVQDWHCGTDRIQRPTQYLI